MTSVNERPYLSIGEVLGLLLEEFPDITISKIRFLESQGLIEPERTASGYRKFFDPDVERLRVILREQRENFLPLRVIRDRLENGEIDDASLPGGAGSATAPRGIRNVRMEAGTDDTGAYDLDDTGPIEADPTGTISVHADLVNSSRHPAAKFRSPSPTEQIPVTPAPHAAPVVMPPAPSPVGAPAVSPAAVVPAAAPPAPPVLTVVPTTRPTPAAPPVEATSDVYVRAEVCSLAGITAAQLAELESFGLVSGRGTGASTTYTDGDLAVVRAAAGFLARGIDARHLRAWRQSAEREASLFEQRILPLLRQRNPQARQDAVALLGDLADLGGQLRDALVGQLLRHHLDP